MGRRWFPAAEMDLVLWTDEGGDSVTAPGMLSQQGWRCHPTGAEPLPRCILATLTSPVPSPSPVGTDRCKGVMTG